MPKGLTAERSLTELNLLQNAACSFDFDDGRGLAPENTKTSVAEDDHKEQCCLKLGMSTIDDNHCINSCVC